MCYAYCRALSLTVLGRTLHGCAARLVVPRISIVDPSPCVNTTGTGSSCPAWLWSSSIKMHHVMHHQLSRGFLLGIVMGWNSANWLQGWYFVMIPIGLATFTFQC